MGPWARARLGLRWAWGRPLTCRPGQGQAGRKGRGWEGEGGPGRGREDGGAREPPGCSRLLSPTWEQDGALQPLGSVLSGQCPLSSSSLSGPGSRPPRPTIRVSLPRQRQDPASSLGPHPGLQRGPGAGSRHQGCLPDEGHALAPARPCASLTLSVPPVSWVTPAQLPEQREQSPRRAHVCPGRASWKLRAREDRPPPLPDPPRGLRAAGHS